jgi:hypothetical protein
MISVNYPYLIRRKAVDNTGGIPERERRVKELDQLAKHYRSQVQEREQSGVLSEGGVRNLTLPLDILTHLHLEKLADKLGQSKTAVAVDILMIAVRDVHFQVFGQPLSEEDIEEYQRRGEGKIPTLERKIREPRGRRQERTSLEEIDESF